MIGEILQANLDECKALLSGTGAQIMFKTDFLTKNVPDREGNLILLAIDDAQDTFQYPGGLTQTGWRFSFNSYNYEPDAYVDDDSGYSTSLLNFIDTVRRHFSSAGLYGRKNIDSGDIEPGLTYKVIAGAITYNGNLIDTNYYFVGVGGIKTFTTTNGGRIMNTGWLTPGMADVFNSYNFQYTLTGLTRAEPIDESGIILGYNIGFDSTALDFETCYVNELIPLQTITQIDNPPFSPNDPIS